jgi:phosphoglycolate phosphatase
VGKTKAVLLDLDGTLLDSAPDIAEAVNRMRADFSLPALSHERITSFVGKGADRLVHRAMQDDMHGELDHDQFSPAKSAFETHYRQTNGTASMVFDGVVDGVRLLRDAGIPLACVTNKPREFTLVLLERTGLLPYLDVVVCGDDVERRKPHPDPLWLACRELDVLPAHTCMIGDSANDAEAAHAAGCPCLLVETGYNEGASVHDLKAAPGVGGIFPLLSDAARWVVQN